MERAWRRKFEPQQATSQAESPNTPQHGTGTQITPVQKPVTPHRAHLGASLDGSASGDLRQLMKITWRSEPPRRSCGVIESSRTDRFLKLTFSLDLSANSGKTWLYVKKKSTGYQKLHKSSYWMEPRQTLSHQRNTWYNPEWPLSFKLLFPRSEINFEPRLINMYKKKKHLKVLREVVICWWKLQNSCRLGRYGVHLQQINIWAAAAAVNNNIPA